MSVNTKIQNVLKSPSQPLVVALSLRRGRGREEGSRVDLVEDNLPHKRHIAAVVRAVEVKSLVRQRRGGMHICKQRGEICEVDPANWQQRLAGVEMRVGSAQSSLLGVGTPVGR